MRTPSKQPPKKNNPNTPQNTPNQTASSGPNSVAHRIANRTGQNSGSNSGGNSGTGAQNPSGTGNSGPSQQQAQAQTSSLRTNLSQSSNRASAPNGSAVVPSKRILRQGKLIRVPLKYVLKPGEFPVDEKSFTHHPQVIFNRGKMLYTIDEHGNSKVSDFNKKTVPTHKNLQSQRYQQGQELGRRIRNSHDLVNETLRMRNLAESLELYAGNSVPSNHEQKIKDLLKKNFTGSDYRKVILGQDELTQSRATTEFFAGVRQALGGMTTQQRAFVEQALRAFSALRTPTSTVNAPIMHNGQMTGQQHPNPNPEKLKGGGSGHSYADRMRVFEQIQGFNQLEQDPSTSPMLLVMGNLLSALVSTLSTMSFPNTADNVPDLQTSRASAQHDERGRMKMQTGLIGIKMELDASPTQSQATALDQSIKPHAADQPPPKKRQKMSRRMSEPVIRHPYRAASPIRIDDEDSDLEIIGHSGAQSEYDSEDNTPIMPPSKNFAPPRRPSVPNLHRINQPPVPQPLPSKPLDLTKYVNSTKTPKTSRSKRLKKTSKSKLTSTSKLRSKLKKKSRKPAKPIPITGMPSSQTAQAPNTNFGNQHGFTPFPNLRKMPPPPNVANIPQVPPSARQSPLVERLRQLGFSLRLPRNAQHFRASDFSRVSEKTGQVLFSEKHSLTLPSTQTEFEPPVQDSSESNSVAPSNPFAQTTQPPRQTVPQPKIPNAPQPQIQSPPKAQPQTQPQIQAPSKPQTQTQTQAPQTTFTPVTNPILPGPPMTVSGLVGPLYTLSGFYPLQLVPVQLIPVKLVQLASTEQVIHNRYIQDMTNLIRSRVRNDKQTDKAKFDETHKKAMGQAAHTVEGVNALSQIFEELQRNYRAMAGSLRRQFTQGNEPMENRFSNQGRRLPALEQYFHECGQMAVHNVLALDRWNRNRGDLGAMLQDHNALNHLGGPQAEENFRDDLGEGELRAMLARAGQQGIPVIGNLGQLEGFIQHYNIGNAIGHLFNLPNNGAQILQGFGVQNQERQGIDNMMNFLYRRTNSINFIINTESHKYQQGLHWIAVRLVRRRDGFISLEYLDSLNGAHDYQDLFAELRRFIDRNAAAPVVTAVPLVPVAVYKPHDKGGPGGGPGGNNGPGFGGGGGGGNHGPMPISSFG
ncbi:MAG: hypothetical protein AAGN35_06965 [Bacteroidota bacterium]